MGTVPTPPTLVAGAVLTAAQLNQMRDCINFWALTPRCKVVQATTAQSFTNNAYDTVTYNSEAFDVVQSGDTPMHDNVTNNSRVTIRTAGKYNITALVSFATNATGTRKILLAKNGVQISGASQPAVSGASTSVVVGPVLESCAVGDYIEVQAYQNSGAALAMDIGAGGNYLYVAMDSQ